MCFYRCVAHVNVVFLHEAAGSWAAGEIIKLRRQWTWRKSILRAEQGKITGQRTVVSTEMYNEFDGYK